MGEDRYSVQPEEAPQPQEFLIVPERDGHRGYLQMFLWVFQRQK